ncbi:MAG: hypothetical protein L0H36_02100 [bacterium]|nr:hypothetical protein [bacterium]MDN5835407.1 hypothetical protein [bacterium]
MEAYKYPSQNEKIYQSTKEKERAYGELVILLLSRENEKDPYIKDNPNIVPGTE